VFRDKVIQAAAGSAAITTAELGEEEQESPESLSGPEDQDLLTLGTMAATGDYQL
jgi:hypothetical protein